MPISHDLTEKHAAKDFACPLCHDFSDTKNTRALRSNKDILIYLDHFRDERQEYLVCLSLDSGQRLIARRVVTIGLLDVALAHPREVFAGPLTDRAASVIIAHNHPSGDPTPSKQDIQMTQQLVAAGLLLGIPVKDHLVVTSSAYYSFSRHGLI